MPLQIEISQEDLAHNQQCEPLREYLKHKKVEKQKEKIIAKIEDRAPSKFKLTKGQTTDSNGAILSTRKPHVSPIIRQVPVSVSQHSV